MTHGLRSQQKFRPLSQLVGFWQIEDVPTTMKVIGIALAVVLLIAAVLLFLSTRKRVGRRGVFSSKTRDRFIRTRSRRG